MEVFGDKGYLSIEEFIDGDVVESELVCGEDMDRERSGDVGE